MSTTLQLSLKLGMYVFCRWSYNMQLLQQ